MQIYGKLLAITFARFCLDMLDYLGTIY